MELSFQLEITPRSLLEREPPTLEMYPGHIHNGDGQLPPGSRQFLADVDKVEIEVGIVF